MPFKNPEEAARYNKEYREKNKEKLAKQSAEYFQKHKKRFRALNKQWLENNFNYTLWKRAKDSSRVRNLEFTITPADVIIPTHCPYLNIELTTSLCGKRLDSNASLDRIDNTKGYIPGNIQVISSKANYMKRNATIEELKAFAKGILEVHA